MTPLDVVRRTLARRRAAQGRLPEALRAAPDDPLVLAQAGMLASVMERTEGVRDGDGRFARALALAGLGRLDEAGALLPLIGPLTADRRRRMAAAGAPFDPNWALEMLPAGDVEARAACALSAGDAALAGELHAALPASAEREMLGAAVAAAQGRHADARAAFNAAMAEQGLAAPLEAAEAPIAMDALRRPAGLAEVDGPLLSVVIPVRDGADGLEVAVRSVLAQTWRNLEVLVVDDGSKDASPRIAAELAAADRRVRVLANARTPGVSGARNTGVLASRGDYVGFLDADDWAHPQRFERQVHALAPNAAGAIARHVRLSAAGAPCAQRGFPLIRTSPITLLLRRDALDALGPIDEVPHGADSELLGRALAAFGRRGVARAQSVLLVAAVRAGSLTTDPVTGLFSDQGARDRLTYVEDWRRRHARSARLQPAGWLGAQQSRRIDA